MADKRLFVRTSDNPEFFHSEPSTVAGTIVSEQIRTIDCITPGVDFYGSNTPNKPQTSFITWRLSSREEYIRLKDTYLLFDVEFPALLTNTDTSSTMMLDGGWSALIRSVLIEEESAMRIEEIQNYGRLSNLMKLLGDVRDDGAQVTEITRSGIERTFRPHWTVGKSVCVTRGHKYRVRLPLFLTKWDKSGADLFPLPLLKRFLNIRVNLQTPCLALTAPVGSSSTRTYHAQLVKVIAYNHPKDNANQPNVQVGYKIVINGELIDTDAALDNLLGPASSHAPCAILIQVDEVRHISFLTASGGVTFPKFVIDGNEAVCGPRTFLTRSLPVVLPGVSGALAAAANDTVCWEGDIILTVVELPSLNTYMRPNNGQTMAIQHYYKITEPKLEVCFVRPASEPHEVNLRLYRENGLTYPYLQTHEQIIPLDITRGTRTVSFNLAYRSTVMIAMFFSPPHASDGNPSDRRTWWCRSLSTFRKYFLNRFAVKIGSQTFPLNSGELDYRILNVNTAQTAAIEQLRYGWNAMGYTSGNAPYTADCCEFVDLADKTFFIDGSNNPNYAVERNPSFAPPVEADPGENNGWADQTRVPGNCSELNSFMWDTNSFVLVVKLAKTNFGQLRGMDTTGTATATAMFDFQPNHDVTIPTNFHVITFFESMATIKSTFDSVST